MKTSAIISGTCFALLLAVSGNAQDTETPAPAADPRSKLYFGLRAGANNSNVYDERGEEFRPQPTYGFAGGAFVSLPISRYLGVQPEVLLSQKGFYATGMSLGSKYNFKRTSTYLDIPIMLAVKPSRYFSILAGPQYSYLLRQHDVFVDELVTSEQIREFENDNIRKNVVGATVGFDVTVSHVVVGGRYSFDLQRNNGDGTSDTPRYKNAWVQGSVGLRF